MQNPSYADADLESDTSLVVTWKSCISSPDLIITFAGILLLLDRQLHGICELTSDSRIEQKSSLEVDERM